MTNTHAQHLLLGLLDRRHPPDVRLGALRILLRRFSSREVWLEAERHVIDLARRYEDATYRGYPVLATVVRVPLASVRYGLGRMADDASSLDQRLELLDALARVGSADAAEALVDHFDEAPNARTAEALAHAPVTLRPATLDALEHSVRGLDHADPEQGAAAVWASLALLRHGRAAAADAMLDKLESGWAPALFWGNPLALHEQVARAVRRSEPVHQFAARRLARLPEHARGAIAEQQHLGDPHLLLLGALQSADVAAEQRPVVTTLSGDADWLVEQLGITGIDLSAPAAFPGCLPAALEALTRRVAEGGPDVAFEAGNLLVDLLESLPAHQPDTAAAVRAYAALCQAANGHFPDLEDQLGWALAQGDMDAVLDAGCALMGGPDAALAKAAAALLARAVEHTPGSFAPRFGAGGADSDALLDDAIQPLIETTWFADRMRERPAAAAPPPDEDTARSVEPDEASPPEEQSPADGRTAYARLDSPASVAPEDWFEVQVGLGARQSSGVSGGSMRLPDSAGDTFELSVTLFADGFRVHTDDRPGATLTVSPQQRYPFFTVRLAAIDSPDLKPARSLMAQFSVGGQMIGAAVRSVQVGDAVAEDAPAAPGVDMVVPPRADAPDLTITITKGNTLRADRLMWSLESPHAELPVSQPSAEADAISDLGEEPGRWARNLMNQVHANASNQQNLSLLLRGTGKAIAAKVPLWVRQCLYRLSAMPDGPKTVLIVSNEPNVPWELAWLELDNGGAGENFLGAEFSVGRWVIGTASAVTGKVKPPYPPPTELGVRRMAVVSGDYSNTRGWKDLEGAHEEAAALASRYGASQVAADGQLASWLDGMEDIDVLHFAVHGKSDMTGANGGIALTDGSMLTPEMIAGLRLKGAPFVFLNACQLGQGEQTLAEYGGVAAAFLEAGAGGVIASLWNVDDAAARELALSFYASGAELQSGASRFIRDVRAQFDQPAAADDPLARAPSLLLAYQFFGHPRMRLELDFQHPTDSTEV